MIAHLPKDVSFFSADLPGCGTSEPPLYWTLGAIADSLAEAITKLPAPVTLVGNCSGALLGIEAAQRVGPSIARMVLIDMLAVFPWYFRIFLAKPFGRYAYATTFQNPLGRWFTNLSLRSKRTQNTTLTGGFSRVDHGVTYKYLQLFESFPQPESFAGFTQPIDLVYGEKTFQAVRESVACWKSVWPQAQSTCLTGAGHLPIQEATSQLNELLFNRHADGGTCQAISTGSAT